MYKHMREACTQCVFMPPCPEWNNHAEHQRTTPTVYTCIYYFIIQSQYRGRVERKSACLCVCNDAAQTRQTTHVRNIYSPLTASQKYTTAALAAVIFSFTKILRMSAGLHKLRVFHLRAVCCVVCESCVYGLDDDQRPSRPPRHHITKHGTGTGSMCRFLQIAKFSSTMVKWLNSQLTTNIVLKEVI